MKMHRALMIRTAAVVATAAMALGLTYAADAPTFNAKPGAWEMTTTMTGAMIPQDVLDKMSPERRAMIEKRIADSQTPRVRKSCVRKEDLAQDRFMPSTDSNCTVRTVSRTPTRLTMASTCTGERASTGTTTLEAKSPESVVGAIEQERANGGKFHIAIAGKWLGASCEGIEPPPAR
jgi:hypothetical protein